MQQFLFVYVDIISTFLAFIFQIILIVKSVQLDSNENSKTLYSVLSIIDLFTLGCIVDIVTTVSFKNGLEHQSVNYPTVQNIAANN